MTYSCFNSSLPLAWQVDHHFFATDSDLPAPATVVRTVAQQHNPPVSQNDLPFVVAAGPSNSSRILLALAWAVVGVPLLVGLQQTGGHVIHLFGK